MRLRFSISCMGPPHRPAFDALLARGALEDPFDINARGHDSVRIQRPGLHQLLHFCDGDAGSRGHHGIEIARRSPVDQVALPIPLQAFTSEKSALSAVSSKYLRPSKVRSSLPSATRVPTPVGV